MLDLSPKMITRRANKLQKNQSKERKKKTSKKINGRVKFSFEIKKEKDLDYLNEY